MKGVPQEIRKKTPQVAAVMSLEEAEVREGEVCRAVGREVWLEV